VNYLATLTVISEYLRGLTLEAVSLMSALYSSIKSVPSSKKLF